ncbi:serine/arginine repetitive matrix protein 5-like [Procambarus clarkii]|uniref:serine/arginine repetitive matrix protein 5-like n=1 Tax=Procambarus clarkii TaxID=6728 RepID=UPI00374286CE
MEILRFFKCPCKSLQPSCIREMELEELRYKIHRQNRKRVAMQRQHERRQEETQMDKRKEKILLHQRPQRSYGLDWTSHSGYSRPDSHSGYSRPDSHSGDNGETSSSLESQAKNIRSRGTPNTLNFVIESRRNMAKITEQNAEREIQNSQSSLDGVVTTPSCDKHICIHSHNFKQNYSLLDDQQCHDNCNAHTGTLQYKDACISTRSNGIFDLSSVKEEQEDSLKNQERPHSFSSQLSVSEPKSQRPHSFSSQLSVSGPKPQRPHSLISQSSASRANLNLKQAALDIFHPKGSRQRFSLVSYGDYLRDEGRRALITPNFIRRSRSEPRLPQANAKTKHPLRDHKHLANRTPQEHLSDGKSSSRRHDSSGRVSTRHKDEKEHRTSRRKYEKRRLEKHENSSFSSSRDERGHSRTSATSGKQTTGVSRRSVEANTTRNTGKHSQVPGRRSEGVAEDARASHSTGTQIHQVELVHTNLQSIIDPCESHNIRNYFPFCGREP